MAHVFIFFLINKKGTTKLQSHTRNFIYRIKYTNFSNDPNLSTSRKMKSNGINYGTSRISTTRDENFDH